MLLHLERGVHAVLLGAIHWRSAIRNLLLRGRVRGCGVGRVPACRLRADANGSLHRLLCGRWVRRIHPLCCGGRCRRVRHRLLLLGKSPLLLLLSHRRLLLDQRLLLLLLLHSHLLLLELLLLLLLGQCLLLVLCLGRRWGTRLSRVICRAGHNVRLHRSGGADRCALRCIGSDGSVRLACLLVLLCRRSR